MKSDIFNNFLISKMNMLLKLIILF